MSDGDVLLLFVIAVGGLAGAIGGIIAGWLKQRIVSAALRLPERLELPVDVRLVAEPVGLRVYASAPEAVEVPVRLAPLPELQELASRIVAAVPEIGPTALSAILGCAKSTAHDLIQRSRERVEIVAE
jgi:hypothetical protein